MKAQKVTILGDGGWGTTLSILLSRKGYDVCLWGLYIDYIERLKKSRINVKFLKGIRIPNRVFITSEIKEALNYSKNIILTVPSQYLRGVLKKIRRRDYRGYRFLSASKGIEDKTLKRMSEVITQELGRVDLAVLSGPNIAYEIARGMPAVSVVASKKFNTARYFQDLLINEKFRVYTNNDIIGIELGGSLKNIIALACGISDGMNLGTNAKAALLTRGLVEISRLGVAMGAKRDTFFGVSGIGDLTTTCTSLHSRNRFVGERIAKGEKLKSIVKKMQMVAEGISTTKAAYALSKKYRVEMPITKEIYHVLYKNKSPKKAVRDLMLRKRKAEH